MVQNLLQIYERGEQSRRLAELYDLVQPLLDQLAEQPADLAGQFGKALHDGRTMRIETVLRDDRVREHLRGPIADAGLNSFAVVPLTAVSCVLVVSKDGPVSEADVNILLVYAGRMIASLAAQREARRAWQWGEQHAGQEEWLWWALNAVPDPIVIIDEQNEVILLNTQAERLLKTGPDDSPGKRRAIELNNFLFSATVSGQTLDQGATLGRELTLVDPIEGDEILFEMITSAATNLRTAGDSAGQERDRLNLILENVANPIVVTDPAGQIILMNQPAERLLQPNDPLPTPQWATSYRANTKLSSFLSALGLDASQARQGEIELTDPETGDPLTMSVTATEVRDTHGTVTAVVAVLQDLTQIRELERRTLQQQLFESEKLAALGRLAATVAHEINNPLEAILNSLYLIVSRTPADDPNRRFLEIASREAKRVSEIIRQMLGFYRTGGALESVEVNEILGETLSLLERQIRAHHIRLDLSLEPDLPAAMASPDQLRQVFMNLILNAQEAMPNGGTLSVSSRVSREADAEFLPGRQVLIQIRDSGMGIIQNFGGQLRVRSRVGSGTTFTVALLPGATE